MLSAVKEALTKEIDVKEFLAMEIEVKRLKELLATEIQLKEFLVQEIDLGSFMSSSVKNKNIEDQNTDKSITSDVNSTKNADNSKVDRGSKPRININNLAAYDHTLVERLHEDHKQIRFYFNKIMSFAIEKDYVKVAGQLEFFNKEIREHYKRADTELYSYLKTYVQIKYPQREKAFNQLSLEMKNLSIEIFYVLTQSPNLPLSEATYKGFMKEFMAMGKLMNERIIREQSVLFEMYQQTNTAKFISEIGDSAEKT